MFRLLVWGALTFVHSLACLAADPVEPMLRKLPPGVTVKSSVEAPAPQRQAIGRKLGGEIDRLTNSVLQVQGRPIQINLITAGDEPSAAAIEGSLKKLKSFPYLLRSDRLLVEYVGQGIDEALALKTSYELGLLEKPGRVRYRLEFELAVIARADYMSCNPLFLQFQQLATSPTAETRAEIRRLSERFTFGQSLALRQPKSAPETSAYHFQPLPSESTPAGSVVKYTFPSLPVREGIPHVFVAVEATADSRAFLAEPNAPESELTAATSFWPVDDPEVRKLAAQIVAGQTTSDEKVAALLRWLSPGRHLKYSGQTGSRYGTRQALDQKFGHCWDFSDCFVTLARAAGVPARQVAGWLYGTSGHVWAEFYRSGEGWQQVDPTGGGDLPCGIYHIPYFTTDTGEMPIVYLRAPKIELFTPPVSPQ